MTPDESKGDAMTPDELNLKVQEASRAAQEKRLDEAVQLLERVLEQDPEHLRALDLMGFVRFFQARYLEAEDCCRRALELDPEHAYAHKGLGLCLARQGRVEEGLESLDRAIAIKPGWFDPYWDKAVMLYEHQRYPEALEVLALGKARVPAGRARFQGLARKISAM